MPRTRRARSPSGGIRVFIDGASRGNPGPAGAGVVFVDERAVPIRTLSKALGQATNNVAEYAALLYALIEAGRAGYTELTIHSDSELLVRQLQGVYRVRDPHLRVLHELARELAKGFVHWSIQHVPREQNAQADRLAGQGAGASANELRVP